MKNSDDRKSLNSNTNIPINNMITSRRGNHNTKPIKATNERGMKSLTLPVGILGAVSPVG